MSKSIIGGLLLCLIGLAGRAQSDSLKVSTVKPEFDFLYSELYNFSSNSIFGELQFNQLSPGLSNFKPTMPLMIDFKLYNSLKGNSLSQYFPAFSPFLNEGFITNQAHYQLNDRLTLGGNSFSANSIYNPLPLNPGMKDMNIRGASIYLEYKVSDKFSIGGGVSVSNQKDPFLP